MTILHVPIFHGIAPRIAARKLNQAQSQIARNCDLFSEELKPLRDSIEVNTPSKVGTKQSIYLLDDKWLHWLTDVDVVRSPLYLENQLRIHYTGDYNPKSTDDTLVSASPGTDYPTDFYRLGMPRPDTAPTIGHTGGASNNIERSYVYTFVSAWGEEGPPSPVTTYTGKADATSWDISALDATPPNQWTHAADITSITFSGTTVTVTLNSGSNHFLETTEYVTISGTTTGTGSLYTDIIGTWQITRVSELVFTFELASAPTGTYTGGAVIDREAPLQTSGLTKRLYRTIAGNYRFVADGITGTSYTDTVDDSDLGELLPGGPSETQWWKAPNGNMQGIIELPGGVLAGFFDNILALCEPNVPSAWPEEYQYKFNNTIVALGVVGNSVVVATNGFPSLVIGDNPASMTITDLEIFQSCISKRGLVSMVNGVMYPSPDGLVYIPAAGMPTIVTEKFFKKQDWALFSPDTFIAGVYDDRYYAFYSNGGADNDEDGAIIFDLKEPGSTFTTLSINADGLHSDLENDSLYLINQGNILEYESGGSYLTYTWLSKLFTTRKPVSMTAAKVKLTMGSGISETEQAAAIAAAITALEAELFVTELSSTFGTANNYYNGGIGGSAIGEYTVGGGPYVNAISGIGNPVTAVMNIYAWYDNGSGYIDRHLVHTENMSNSKPFTIGNIDKGFLADQWEIEFNCDDVVIHEAALGTSMKELARI